MKEFRKPDGRKEPVGYLPNEHPKICTLNCTLKFKNMLNMYYMYFNGSFS